MADDEGRCPGCGEQIEPGFDACWKCGLSFRANQGGDAVEGVAEPLDESAPDLMPAAPNAALPAPHANVKTDASEGEPARLGSDVPERTFRCRGHGGCALRLVIVIAGAGLPIFLVSAGLNFLREGETASVLAAAFLFLTVGLPAAALLLQVPVLLTVWPTLLVGKDGIAVSGFVAFGSRSQDLNWKMSWAEVQSVRRDAQSGDVVVTAIPPGSDRTIHFFSDYEKGEEALQLIRAAALGRGR